MSNGYRPCRIGLTLAAICLAGALNVTALTTNLVAVADTALRNSAPDSNFGATPSLPVGVAMSQPLINRCLFKFDVADRIPANATIVSVTLHLTLTVNPTPAHDYSLHRLLKDWGEGTKSAPANFGGAPASAGEATWNSRMHGTELWGVPGGQAGSDFVTAASATSELTGLGGTFTSGEMLNDVQLWLNDPGANFGWILMAAGEPLGTGKQIGSRENSGNEPVLAIEYTVPSEPAPPVITAPVFDGSQVRFSFMAEAGAPYTVQYRESLAPGDWTSLTNVPAQPAQALIEVSDTPASAMRVYRVRTP